jgi:hypothetical protein
VKESPLSPAEPFGRDPFLFRLFVFDQGLEVAEGDGVAS